MASSTDSAKTAEFHSYLVIELPYSNDVATSLALAHITQYVHKQLSQLGVDPVRTKMMCGENIDSVRVDLCLM